MHSIIGLSVKELERQDCIHETAASTVIGEFCDDTHGCYVLDTFARSNVDKDIPRK